MSSGLDSNNRVDRKVPTLVEDGIKWVGRYINPDKAEPLTLSEARSLHDRVPKIWIVNLFESGNPTRVEYFSQEKGREHGRIMHSQCVKLGVPGTIGSICGAYFTVDYDTPAWEITPVVNYFRGIRETCGGYLIGSYGNGFVCETLVRLGLVHFTWLAGSPGWQNYRMWKSKAQIVQYKEVMLAGLDVDLDESNGAAGGW